MKCRGIVTALLAALALFPGVAFSQQESGADSPSSPALRILSLAGQSSDSFPYYLQILSLGNPGDNDYAGQFTATLEAEMGLYDQAVATFPMGPATVYTPSPLPANQAEVADAADVIARMARERRVVIVNEAHHVAQTRGLFLDLLPRLRQLGFTHYCAETLDSDAATQLRERGYPLRKDGMYSREPVFGEVVRAATRLGYTVCGYESDAAVQQERETGQARNLTALLRNDPEARILVHAGYMHARKALSAYMPMAAELERLTGIEPLTVDQTTLRPDIPVSRENAAYRALSARIEGAKHASVFVDATGKPWSLEPDAYDVSVILPDLVPTHGRAGWLWEIPGKQVVAEFDADCMDHYPCAIEARHAGESDDAVPADIVVHAKADGAAPALALAPGGYRLRTVAPDGHILREADLTVTTPGETSWN